MKAILISLALVFFVGCGSTGTSPEVPPTVPGPVEPQPPVPELPLGVDPSYQVAPVRLTDQNLPVGQCVKMGETFFWRGSIAHDSMPLCTGQALGEPCSSGSQACRINNINALSCQRQEAHRCHGWVMEETKAESGPSSFKPLKDADAYIFYFVGCMIGICGPQSQVVKTDHNGYFEFMTTTMRDSLRIKKDGYFSACNVNRPFAFGGGSFPNNVLEPEVPAIRMQVLKPDSCK